MITNAELPALPADPHAVTALDVASAQGFGPHPKGAPPPKLEGAATPTETAASQIQEGNNPSESLEAASARLTRERGSRVSINTPTRRLEVPPIPGYHLHWFLDRNIPRALSSWYEFVDPKEVPAADRSIGGRTAGTTSEDLGGARVSQIGGINEKGETEHLVLMKCRLEFYYADQRKLAQRNMAMVEQIFHKKAPVMAQGESPEDYDMRYTNQATIDMSNGRFRKV